MMKAAFWLASVLLAVLAAAVVFLLIDTPQPARQAEGAGAVEQRITWQACDGRIFSPAPVSCGRFHSTGASGHFSLPFAIFHYTGADASPEPLVYLAGGPGAGMQTSSDSLQAWAYWLEEADLKRDLIVFDQRGLAPGEPYWDCTAYTRVSAELLEQNLALEEEYRRTQPVLEQCLREFDTWLRSPRVGVPDGIASFSSSRSAADLNDMLALLEYPAWALWGVSYGSRLALVAAQAAPEQVAHLILDSPYPLEQGQLTDKPALYAEALERFDRYCRGNPADCSLAVDQPLALFWRVMGKLRKEPRVVRVRTGSESYSVVLNDHRLLALTIFTLYDSRLYGELLTALVLLDGRSDVPSEAAPESLQLLLQLFVTAALDDEFNSMVFYAIECNDNALEANTAYEAAAQGHPALYPYTVYEGRHNPCALTLFDPDARLKSEPVPAVPALILSGELDPATPAAWARELAERLPRARLRVVADAGHAVLAGGGCGPELLEAFLQEPEAVELASYCR